MSTKYIASNWRLPNEENSGKSDNYGLDFNGTELINCGNPTALQFTSDFSISGWFKTSIVSNQRIVSKDDGTNRSYLVQLNGNSLRCAVFTSGTQQPNDFGSGLADGNWHMLTWVASNGTHTRFNNNQVGMYVDGVYETVHTVPAGNVNYVKVNELFISYSSDSAWAHPSRVDAFQIFDSELTDAQILSVYNGS